ncbi:hypothetical protein K1X12_12000 [Hyphomonas sp. WL0036]|uniref:hypothetical protein n=1 Tax=Hyphomonas sediminis TaxID=2866160 RepID=UPI001C7FEE5A|nr:hypothetical protein [Hyphomonas sediminis]MBY9067625.1 hypothetical protein [Hyphomonas sediminis]
MQALFWIGILLTLLGLIVAIFYLPIWVIVLLGLGIGCLAVAVWDGIAAENRSKLKR